MRYRGKSTYDNKRTKNGTKTDNKRTVLSILLFWPYIELENEQVVSPTALKPLLGDL